VKKALIKRAPLLLLLLGVLFVWQGGFGLWPVERTLTWRLWGDYGSIRRVDVQLYDGDVLLTRADLSFPNGVMYEPTMKVALKKGRYPAKVLVWRAGAENPEIRSIEVVADATTTALTAP
jgi:hypothetical protein